MNLSKKDEELLYEILKERNEDSYTSVREHRLWLRFKAKYSPFVEDVENVEDSAETSELLTIDVDVIRMLKRTGRRAEANEMLKRFHEMGEKNMTEGRKINNKISSRISNHKFRLKNREYFRKYNKKKQKFKNKKES